MTLTATFQGRWRSKHIPDRFRAHLASRGHMIGNIEEFVSFVRHEIRLFVLKTAHRNRFQHIVGFFRRFPSLALAQIQQLENTRDIFGIGPNNVTLRHRSNVEHFAIKFKLGKYSNKFYDSYHKSSTITGSVFCLSLSEL